MSDSLFDVHRLNEEGIQKADQISFLFTNLHKDLLRVCPKDSPQFVIAKNKLEEACFYAKKSMALLDKNQKKGT